jgi:hypothetical protein
MLTPATQLGRAAAAVPDKDSNASAAIVAASRILMRDIPCTSPSEPAVPRRARLGSAPPQENHTLLNAVRLDSVTPAANCLPVDFHAWNTLD